MQHIFLYGPPGSGKTTLGRMLADRLQLPFVDLDQAIESITGKPIPQIIEERGEDGFRDLESSVLKEQLQGTESVIALGGGTLLRKANRMLAESNGKIICLKAEPEILLERLGKEPDARPFLAGNLAEKLAALLAARGRHYNSFDQQFGADREPEQLIEEFQAAIGRFHLGAMDSCDVIVQRGGLDQVGDRLRARKVTHTFIVTDENVAKLHAGRVLDSLLRSGHQPGMVVVPAGESNKTIDTVNRIWHGFLEAGVDRKSTIIALGGGVVGDMAGFAASTFMRGIAWVCLPTTLLSMVDASLGGKTGFDLPEGKNLIGRFHAPRLVLADPHALSTLPEIEFRAGLAEVVKHGVVADPELFDLCAHGRGKVQQDLPEIMQRAVAVKAKIIEADPYEKGERASLNFGHTVGHALELVSGFGIRHGEAVAMGMVAETRLAEQLKIARNGLSEQIAESLSALDLPINMPEELPRSELIRAMGTDKKRADGIVRFSLPLEIGRVKVNVEVRNLELVFAEG